MPPPDPTDPALALVHAGWDHLKHQRPLAAWASWRRALRVEPEHRAASDALHLLANAADLPEAARAEYRFLTPVGGPRRSRWDAGFRGRDLEDLAEAAAAFADLAVADPDDGRARFNQGLCLAWLGHNAAAVAAMSLAVDALAAAEPAVAVSAWTLAQVLAQGGGAEALADDRSHAVTFSWTPGEDPAGFLDGRADVLPVPNPVDPATGLPRLSEARIYEWLDAPWPADPTTAGAFRISATVVRFPGSLRLSGTDAVALDAVASRVARIVGDRVASTLCEESPLPLAFLDAAIWAFRIPPGVDEEARARLNRSAVERYYEAAWIVRPRIGLLGLTPVAAGLAAGSGDPAARARLEAVVRLREQLGARPTTALLYQGYPFDRLRSRLGLDPIDPGAVDPADPTSMGAAGLDRLDPATLDDFALADAYASANALGDDRRTARFAEALAGRRPPAMVGIDVPALFATLVRRALDDDDPDAALGHLDRARALDDSTNGGRDRRKFATWRAEVLARAGRADAAALVYRDLLDRDPDAALALDAAETLLDNGFDGHARDLARRAVDLALGAGDDDLAARARALL